jgi:4-coumarate--CoA ligase (photoactive yellow protein activation family)
VRLSLQRPAAHRIACAVVVAEVRRIREADLPRPGMSDWPEETLIGEEGLGLDSIEQLGALGALAETFNLADSLLGTEPPQTVGDWIDWIMLGHTAPNTQMTVRTSGSTGSPRLCVHAVADLLDEAAFLATQFADRRRVVAMVPAHHLYGIIWTALLPSVLGAPVVLRVIGTALDLIPGDLVVAVPDQWAAMVRLTRRFPGDVMGVSSAGPLDDTIAIGLLRAGLVRLVDVYGSSETGAIALRDLPATVYDLLPRWHLTAQGDQDWRLVSGSGKLMELPDHIERTGERSLRPVGRRDGAVQVAGHNVWPERIAQLLRETDGVADAAVRLHANGRLKAFVVLHDGRHPVEMAPLLEQVVAARLAPHQRPTSFRFGATLPRNVMGKLEDWA